MPEFASTTFIPQIHPWNQDIWNKLTLEPERANHALLFSGASGLGKQDLALALAHFVITDANDQSALLFNAGSHPDLHIIMPQAKVNEDLVGQFAQRYLTPHGGKPKNTITVDQIRMLNESMATHPHISTHRVILILYAHTMNRNAANALLKSLEEPPAHTLFVVVSDEISRLAKTIRSRCSIVNFNAPDTASATAWLAAQNELSETDVNTHLAMANNSPLLALQMYRDDYLSALKTIFTDVNGLWTQRTEVTKAAKNWQDVGALQAVDILQKLSTDLLRCRLTEDPKAVFFPVQKPWIQSVSGKLSKSKLLALLDELIYAKQMLHTTVDELLVLETLSIKFNGLPS